MSKKVNRKDRKLIVCDLDGTLLTADEKISNYTEKVVKEFTKQGHVFCIATGRPLRSSIDIYRRLNLKTIIANLNGSIITNPSDQNFMPINLTFSKDVVKEIVSLKEISNDFDTIILENYDATYILMDGNDETIGNELLKKFHIDGVESCQRIRIKDLESVSKDLNSILIHLKDKRKIDALSFKIKSITNTLVVRTWSIPGDFEGTVIEINSIFSSKGTTMKFLSSFYSIPLANCYAFGDGENDLEMFRTTTNGYALKNGSQLLKLSSQYITRFDNDHDGVAREMNTIFKLKVPYKKECC